MPLPLIPIVGGSLLLLYWKQRSGAAAPPTSSQSPVQPQKWQSVEGTSLITKDATAARATNLMDFHNVGTPLDPINPLTGQHVRVPTAAEASIYIAQECARVAAYSGKNPVNTEGGEDGGIVSRDEWGNNAPGGAFLSGLAGSTVWQNFAGTMNALGYSDNYAEAFYKRMSDVQWVEWNWLCAGPYAQHGIQWGIEGMPKAHYQPSVFSGIHPRMLGVAVPLDWQGHMWPRDFTGFGPYKAVLVAWVNAQHLVTQSAGPYAYLASLGQLQPVSPGTGTQTTSSGNTFNAPTGNATSQQGGH